MGRVTEAGETGTSRIESTAAKAGPVQIKSLVRWILVASAKGGSGKTTTVQNLATLAAADGLNVLVVDLDSQGTLTRWARRRPTGAPKIEAMTTRLRDVCDDAKGGLAEVEQRSGESDIVLLDTPPSLDDWPKETLRLVKRADLTLIPTTQGVNDLDSVVEWMATLKREKAKASFVLNQVDRTQTSFVKAKARLNKIGMLCPMDVRRLADIRNAAEHGLGVIEVGGSNGAEEFVPIWDFVKNMIGFEN